MQLTKEKVIKLLLLKLSTFTDAKKRFFRISIRKS